jgi:hypothetical protein
MYYIVHYCSKLLIAVWCGVQGRRRPFSSSSTSPSGSWLADPRYKKKAKKALSSNEGGAGGWAKGARKVLQPSVKFVGGIVSVLGGEVDTTGAWLALELPRPVRQQANRNAASEAMVSAIAS